MIIDPEQKEIPKSCGGKAYQLYRLSCAFRVPRFFVVTGNTSDINQEDADVIQEKISPSKMYAVRSSANVEDSKTAAFAGMFDTYLNISPSEVVKHINLVIKSSNNHRLKSYMEEKGIDSKVEVSVIVQEMVDSDSSGVALSIAPNRSDCILVEAVFGLGETLVSSKAEPDSWSVVRENNMVSEHTKGKQLIMMQHGKTIRLDSFVQYQDKLSEEKVIEVCKALKIIEGGLSINPVDIEFAFVKNELYLLQARPQVRGK